MGKRGNPNWQPGVSGNPEGRPKSPEREILRQALEEAKVKHKGKHLIQLCVENAYKPIRGQKDREIILKKILPDLSEEKLGIENLSDLVGLLARRRKDNERHDNS